jgi:hypothetical protein
MTEGYFYGTRMTLLTGLLSALALYQKATDSDSGPAPFLRQFVTRELGSMKIWGESAIPYFALTALHLEATGQQVVAESLIISTLKTVLEINGGETNRRGLPSPYYSPDEAIRFQMSLDEDRIEDFVGASYTAAALIDFLARRWRRQALRQFWFLITAMTMRAFSPKEPWQWFLWRSEEGDMTSRLPNSPQSWTALLKDVEAVDLSVLPKALLEKPDFAFFFVLVYPHRFTRELLKLIEKTVP